MLLLILALNQCRKDGDNPRWDVGVLGPVAKATLRISNLIPDSSIQTTMQGAQILFFDDIISEIKLDSIYQIADTTIPTIVTFPPFSSPVAPGSQFISNNNNIVLGVGNVQLKRAIISSGKIRLQLKNTLPSKVDYTYSIPHAIKDGHAFIVNFAVDSGSLSQPKFFSQDYDFSGYDIDMTGVTGSSYNTIAYNVVGRSDLAGDTFIIHANDTIVNLKTSLIQIEPYYVRGYLGQAITNETDSKSLGIGPLVKNGSILLDSVQLNLDLINYIGTDEQALITNITSKNNRTSNSIDLTGSSFVQHYININRATINSSLSDSLVPTHYLIQLDKNNSNLKTLLENTPDTISINAKFNLNPLGNISGSNDFVYRDRLINAHVQLRMPLRFAMDQFTLADTVPFTISNISDYDNVGVTNLTLLVDNGFPFDMNVQFFFIDKNQTIVDSLFVNDYIKGAPVDVNFRASSLQHTEIKIPIDVQRKNRLLSVNRTGIRLKFNTPSNPQLVQLYSDYHLDLKLVADGTYSIH